MADEPVGDDETNFSEILGQGQKPTNEIKPEVLSTKPDKNISSKPEPNQKIVVTIVHKTLPEPEAKPEPKAEPKVEPKQEVKAAPPPEVQKTTTTTTTYLQEPPAPYPPAPPPTQVVQLQMVRTDIPPNPYECPNCKVICLEDKVPCCIIACIIIGAIFLFPCGLFFLFGLMCQRKECNRCGYKEKKGFVCFYVCFGVLCPLPYLTIIVLVILLILGVLASPPNI